MGLVHRHKHGGPTAARTVCVCLLLQDLVQSCLRVCGGDIGGHVLRETTSLGLCGLVCPSHTTEHGGEGVCVKEGTVFVFITVSCVYYCST